LEVGITGHNFGRGPSMDHSTKVWLQFAQWFLRRRLKCEMLTDWRRTKGDDNSSHFGVWNFGHFWFPCVLIFLSIHSDRKWKCSHFNQRYYVYTVTYRIYSNKIWLCVDINCLMLYRNTSNLTFRIVKSVWLLIVWPFSFYFGVWNFGHFWFPCVLIFLSIHSDRKWKCSHLTDDGRKVMTIAHMA
jgi:hypothetical protein